VNFKFRPLRAARYYKLKFLRLKGDADSIGRGVGLGIFVGITPTIPFHTIALVVLSPLLRANIIASLLAATVVSNPMTFFAQYYLSWKIGNWFFPSKVSWNTIQSFLDYIASDASFRETVAAFLHIGSQTMITLLAGGFILALLPAIAGYLVSRFLIQRFHKKRSQKHILS